MLVKEACKVGARGAGVVIALWAGMQCGGSGDSGNRNGTGGSAGSSTGTGGTGTGTGGAPGAGGIIGTGGGTSGLDAPTTGTDVCPLPPTMAPDAVIYDGSRAGASCGQTTKPPRGAAWFSYDDGTAVDGGMPRLLRGDFGGCGGQTDCAMHITGAGFTNYGAGMGFDMLDMGGAAVPVDATAYAGIQFWARGTINGTRGPSYVSSPQTIHVKILTQLPDRRGDDFGFYCQMIMDGTTWTQCNSAFAAMSRDGFRNDTVPVAGDMLDLSQLLKIQFEFSKFTDPPDATPTSVGFDFWIDNVAFY
jgi:hypothetical protein